MQFYGVSNVLFLSYGEGTFLFFSANQSDQTYMASTFPYFGSECYGVFVNLIIDFTLG